MLAYHLLLGLSKIDHKNQYLLYSFLPIPENILAKLGGNFTNLVLKPSRFWMQARLSIEQIVSPVQVFLGLNQALPLLTKSKSVVFVLDLAFELYPETFNNPQKLAWQTRSAVKKADRIVAISQSTKKDLGKIYQTEQNKIKVIYLGTT